MNIFMDYEKSLYFFWGGDATRHSRINDFEKLALASKAFWHQS